MEDFLWKGLEILLGALGTVLLWLGAKLSSYIATKIKQEYLRGVLVRLSDAVFTAVKEIEQTITKELKAANADGRLDDTEKARIKDAAIRSVKSYLGAKGLGEISKVLGFNAQQVDNFLGSKVEAAVHDIRATTAAIQSAAAISPSEARKPLVPR